MSKLNTSFSNNSFQEKYDEMMLCIDQANALINVGITARFSELDDATIFHYFIILSDIIENAKCSAKTFSER